MSIYLYDPVECPLDYWVYQHVLLTLGVPSQLHHANIELHNAGGYFLIYLADLAFFWI